MHAILNDVSTCIGCEECVTACRRANELGADLPFRWRRGDGLSAERWTTIVRLPGGHNVRRFCRHCIEPACASACPVAALHRTEDGAVVYDSSRCMGCRYCMMACPYGIPRYSWIRSIPYVRKCILCNDRVQAGGRPACVEACPTGSTVFGERDELLAEARRRLEASPDQYVQHIWGEHEVGGTAILHISDVDICGEPLRCNAGDEPLPHTTWGALSTVPGVFVGVGLTMAGVSWVSARRQRIAAEKAAADAEAAAKAEKKAAAKAEKKADAKAEKKADAKAAAKAEKKADAEPGSDDEGKTEGEP